MKLSACFLSYQTSDAAKHSMVDNRGCLLFSVVSLCVFVCEAEEWERQGQSTKSVLSGCVTAKLKFVSALHIQSQCALHCTLQKSGPQ